MKMEEESYRGGNKNLYSSKCSEHPVARLHLVLEHIKEELHREFVGVHSVLQLMVLAILYV